MNFEEVLMRYGITSEMIEKFEEMALEIRKQDDLYSTAYKTITSQIYHQFFKHHKYLKSLINLALVSGQHLAIKRRYTYSKGIFFDLGTNPGPLASHASTIF